MWLLTLAGAYGAGREIDNGALAALAGLGVGLLGAVVGGLAAGMTGVFNSAEVAAQMIVNAPVCMVIGCVAALVSRARTRSEAATGGAPPAIPRMCAHCNTYVPPGLALCPGCNRAEGDPAV